ncbi:hypothetical protein [Amycolatopsis lurida]|uniref:hypothetical protein n=1 Tax=Amycolatopsis lurida TaxID=31959 RepID=UPI000ADE1503|nr:hypothetical protein [Amycolatopsis lurida]
MQCGHGELNHLTAFDLAAEATAARLLCVRLAVRKGQLDSASAQLRRVHLPGKNAPVEQ